MVQRYLARLGHIFMHNAIAPYAIVLIAVESIVAIYYGYFETSRLWFELAISGIITALVGFPAIWFFMSQHRRLEALSVQLERISGLDQMTGLLNRQTFLSRVAKVIGRAPSGESAGAFAYIDADHFKAINDSFGHAAGDMVIHLIAGALVASIRPGDLCCRLGGEEFGVFLEGASPELADAVAQRIRSQISRRSDELSDTTVRPSVSIGIAAHWPGAGVIEVMQAADEQLYVAKRAGRDAVAVAAHNTRAA